MVARQAWQNALICFSLLLLNGCSSGKEILDHTQPTEVQTYFVRVHFRLPNTTDVSGWGIHYWSAGSLSPPWGNPRLFSEQDEFGGYTDIAITEPESWLRLLPVKCQHGVQTCVRGVETEARFVDLEISTDNQVAECWITHGKALLRTRPSKGRATYRISREGEYIDLGDERVRLMFRVAPGSTGEVSYGTAAHELTYKKEWSAAANINRQGLLLDGLNTVGKYYYQITTRLGEEQDQSAILSFDKIQFKGPTKTASWARQAIFYEVLVRTFADGGKVKAVTDKKKESGIDPAEADGVGDLVGLRKQLVYLADLGITAIFLTPIFEAPSYHGYDTVDFYDVAPDYGTLKDFEDLIAAAHQLGMRIILDLVQNHVADNNPWFLAAYDPSREDHQRHRDWFVWADDYTDMAERNHPFLAGQGMWTCRRYICYHTIFGPTKPELNFRNKAVRTEMKELAKFWVELGVDGFRLAGAQHIDQFDDNHQIVPEIHATHVWWKEFNAFVKTLRPEAEAVFLVGENRWDKVAMAHQMVPYAADMDAQFDFPLTAAITDFVLGENIDFIQYIGDMRRSLDKINPNHFLATLLSNHDMTRPASELRARLKVARQEENNGQVTAMLKQLAAIVMTLPGTPFIYYGEELGSLGRRDWYFLENVEWRSSDARDEFIREPMDWKADLLFRAETLFDDQGRVIKGQDPNKTGSFGVVKVSHDIDFLKSGLPMTKAPNPSYPFIKFMAAQDGISVEEQKVKAGSLYETYRELLSLRKGQPMFTDPDSLYTTIDGLGEDLYGYTISKGTDQIVVIHNRRNEPQTVEYSDFELVLLAEGTGPLFELPAYGTLILKAIVIED